MTSPVTDVRDFRRTLGQFPTGVTVITTRTAAGEPVGVTASSFNSVSVDPPLVLWSVDRGAFSAAVFEQAEYFTVNVLADSQMDLSNRFAGRGEDKFAGVSYRNGLGDSPLLENCAAQFQCKTWSLYDGGDHIIVVGEVQEYARNDAMSPLVFSQGGYAVSVPHPSKASANTATDGESSFLSDYLLYLLRIAYTSYSSKLYPVLADSYGISPGGWRALTILADKGALALEDLAVESAQPYVECRDVVERLRGDKLVVVDDASGEISLTLDGQDQCKKMSVLAKDQERSVLAKIPDLDAAALKESLTKMIDAL